MRLKDADALLEYLMINMGWHDEDGREVDDWDEKREIIKDLIDGVPTVDAVPVVRCKDCKYSAILIADDIVLDCYCRLHDLSVDEEFYCAKGKKENKDG